MSLFYIFNFGSRFSCPHRVVTLRLQVKNSTPPSPVISTKFPNLERFIPPNENGSLQNFLIIKCTLNE